MADTIQGAAIHTLLVLEKDYPSSDADKLQALLLLAVSDSR